MEETHTNALTVRDVECVLKNIYYARWKTLPAVLLHGWERIYDLLIKSGTLVTKIAILFFCIKPAARAGQS